MAKELPFFKFEPGRWDNGHIQMCSFEEQGIFINLCSIYWQRLGDLPYALALRKVCGGNATALDSLCDRQIIKVDKAMISIDFLDEQLAEFENVRETNTKNARSRWEKRRKYDRNATAMRPHSDRNAIRGEERRGDERENQSLYAEVNAFLQRKNPNTMDVAFMVRQWQDQGVKDIMPRLKAMKAYYTANDWKFPTKIETLTQSLLDADWTEKLKELNPERKAETVANLKYIPKEAEHDTIGTSAPGSLQ